MHLSSNADERQLLLAMLSVLAGLKVPDAPGLIRIVLMAGLLESDNAIWSKIESFVSAKAFWQVVQDYIELYDSKPSLQKLLTQLLTTHLGTALKAPLPDKLVPLRIERGQQAYAFISQWMRDQVDADKLRTLSQHIGNDLNIFNQLESFSLADLQEADTFEAIDQILIRQCVEAIMGDTDSWQAWKTLLQTRKTLFWAAKYSAIYQALEAAIQLKELQKSYDMGFKQPAQKLFAAYAAELYKFDRAYRTFIVASDAAQGDILKALVEYIENLYSGRFLGDLGYAWSEALGPQWELDGIPRQSQFFKQNVEPILQRSDREKVCVIISDAMRYEVATELKELIEQELRGDTALTPQLGMLPSVTKLGMAALLPGKSLRLLPGQSDVRKDGLSTQGTESRTKVLKQHCDVSTTVLQASDLLAVNTAQGREAIRPHRVIYIYHDVIDGTGDKAPTERQVLRACDTAIAEVIKLVKRLCNSLNATNVIITADHGFQYQRRPINESDKYAMPKGDDIVETNRRYVLSTKTLIDDKTLTFPLPHTDPPLNIVTPRGSIRFSLQGKGAQYVHGGSSLQEVCVPVITYHHKRPTKGDDGPAQKVGVQISARNRRVTNNRFTIRVLQTDAVEGRWRQRSVTVALYDPSSGQALTDIKTIILNSSSAQPSDREFPQTLTVGTTNPPSSAHLIVKDADDDSELIKETWTVSIGISNDFGDF